jgi:hypothetical protein
MNALERYIPTGNKKKTLAFNLLESMDVLMHL